jgi:hypothetical protein
MPTMVSSREVNAAGSAENEHEMSASSDELFAQIARLTDGPRDRAIERRILRLRHLAGIRLTDEHEHLVDFPEPNADGLPKSDRIPEVGPEAVTPSLLRAAILRNGCLLVRSLVARDAAEHLAAEIGRAFAERERAEAGGPAEPGYYEEMRFEQPYRPPVRGWIKSAGGLLAADSPRLAFDIFETFGRFGVSDLVRGYLGPAVLSAEKTTLRKLALTNTGAWHQDDAFMGDVRALNIGSPSPIVVTTRRAWTSCRAVWSHCYRPKACSPRIRSDRVRRKKPPAAPPSCDRSSSPATR